METKRSQIVAKKNNFSVANISFSSGESQLNEPAKTFLTQFAADFQQDTASGEVDKIGTDVDDPNEVTGKIIADEKNYYWRVDNSGKAGPVWQFTTINQAPTVDAGLKQAKWLASGGGSVIFQLAPTVSDDGLPVPPGGLTYLWTKTATRKWPKGYTRENR